MKRKEFIQKTTVVVAGSTLLPFGACKERARNDVATVPEPRSNWAGNYSYKAEQLHEPKSVEEARLLVKKLGKQKALGSKHCFNGIADSPKNQISTKYLNNIFPVDESNKTITIESGVKYGDFAEALHQQGYAVHNLASLPHITVAGACATATHGSGVNNGNLATSVVTLELVTAEGEVKQIDKSHPDFNAIVVGLGAFGLITKLTLEVQDTFEVRQDVFLDLPLQSLESNFEEIISSGYSVSMFTDWMDQKISEVWIKRRLDQPVNDLGDIFFGAQAATRSVHPILALSAENCTEQMGKAGPWYERLPHFKMGFVPSVGNELQSEYFIPRTNAVEGILAIESLKDQIAPVLLISEIRSIAADNFWMSPCYKQDCIAFHFTWKQLTKEVLKVLPKIEDALRPFGVKPHWGKLFSMDPKELQGRYAKFPDFVALAKSYDPQGKFKNAFLTKNLY